MSPRPMRIEDAIIYKDRQIVQLPYVIKSSTQMKEAIARKKELEDQFSNSKYSTHTLSMNDIRKMCGREKIYVHEDPMKCEIRLYTRHEAKYLNHARLGQCPNCGANDWSPTFMLSTDELYELIDYSCAYCGTRKEK